MSRVRPSNEQRGDTFAEWLRLGLLVLERYSSAAGRRRSDASPTPGDPPEQTEFSMLPRQPPVSRPVATSGASYLDGADAVRNFATWKKVRVIVGSVPSTLDQIDAETIP